MGTISFNDNDLREWVGTAEWIRDRFGLDKALVCLIGERFYNLVYALHSSRKMTRVIDEERKKPGYKPIIERDIGMRKYTQNLDVTYEREKEIATEAEELLAKFATLIKGAFDPNEIRKYFESHPRLGTTGLASNEEYDFIGQKGAVGHSIDTELENALIFRDMMKYFGIS